MAETEASAGQTRSPRVAVIGCGLWGRNHVRNYAELGALEALVDHHDENLRALTAQHGGRALPFEAVLADPRIDACVFALPPAQHHALGKRALEAGKHVFLEKPMSLRVEQAEELCDLAERRGRVLMVGHILQYHPVFRALKEIVRGGRLGRILSITAHRLNLGRIRHEEDVLWELAPHDISMILGLVGTEPVGVEAVGGRHLRPGIADVAAAHLAFPGGEQAHVFVSWLHPFKEQKLVVVGSEAMAVFNDAEIWERKLLLYPHKIAWTEGRPAPQPGEPMPVEVERGEPLREECRHFLDCIRTGDRPLTDGREGLRVLRVLQRASASYALSRAA